MKNQFVPYELALKLKELGFKETCFAYWWFREDIHKKGEQVLFTNKIVSYFELAEYDILAPLWQQVFYWFRNNCDLNGEVQTNLPLVTLHIDEEGNTDEELQWQYNYRIIHNKDGIKCDVWESKSINSYAHYDSHEEARVGLVRKLIEIKENGKVV